MTFPTRTVTNASYASASSYGVVLPGGITAGQLIRIKVEGGGVNAFNSLAGWEEQYNTNNGVNMIFASFAKVSDGTEGGTTVTVTRTGSGTGASQVEIWSDTFEDATEITVSTIRTQNTSNPDPNSVTAAWGSDDNTFIEDVFFAGDAQMTAASTGFGDISNGNSAGGSIMSATRQLASDTLDPDATTVNNSGFFTSYTVVIRPANAVPLITDVNGDDTVDIDNPASINGTNLGLVLSNGVRLQDSTATYTQDQTIDTQSSAEIVTDAIVLGDVPRTSASHQIQVRVTDGTNSDTQDVTIVDPAGTTTTEITGDLGTDQSLAYVINGGTVPDASQLYGPTETRGGATITYYADGHFETGPGGTEPDYIDDIQLWTAADGWTTPQDIEINDGEVVATTAEYVRGMAVSSTGALICLDATPTDVRFAEGIPISGAGQVYVHSLSTSPVPAGSQNVNGLKVTSSSRLCITDQTPTGSNYVNGLRLRGDGAIYVSTSAPEATDRLVNGLKVSNSGKLRVVI